nr:malto-oligosyltrehalose synthase [Deinobacterium chartae]
MPLASYRLQLHAGFTFKDAQAALPYLERLGVRDVYTSPYLQAEQGSTHGYNLVSHTHLNPEIGSEQDYLAFTDAIRSRGMGHILDIVPNHMGIGGNDNAWWQDVLENGPSSLYADFFDIDWDPARPGLRGKVLLPILGDQYGQVLERGELQLSREGGQFWLNYYQRRLPISPDSLIPLLERAASDLAARHPEPENPAELEAQDPELAELRSIITALSYLPKAGSTEPEARLERAREKEVVKRRLEVLCSASNAACAAVDRATVRFNGTPGDPGSFDDLDALLREQSYRLAFWRVATEEINYRRFFDINDLAAIRMEDQRVFDASHTLVLRYLEEGRISGLRLDHTDGLYEPLGYFRKLQRARFAQLHADEDERAAFEERLQSEWVPQLPRPLYVWAEKILETGEQLPKRWPIHGTTGYDFLALVNGLWVDPRAERSLGATYQRFAGERMNYPDLLLANKRLIMRTSLSSEVTVLARALERIAESNRRSRDFTLASLTTAIVETIAAFPVYRTYLREDGSREENDDRYILEAISRAKRENPSLSSRVFDFLADVLLLHYPDNASEQQRAEMVRFALKFQQVTSPVMAKGAEDTSFYTYNRLVSLNEVGSDPAHFGTSVAEFHAGNLERLRAWPHSMTALSTHDTKRGEDTRARISVLSEMPQEWRATLTALGRIARAKRSEVDGREAPSRNDEYLFYQTALGAWPLDGNLEGYAERLQAYMDKATREAKVHTSWTNPNPAYDAAVKRFVERMLRDRRFQKTMGELSDRISTYGAVNGLAQTLIKFTAPGMPDTYQGSELWNQSLVDPDNRRPVDYALHARYLEEIESRSERPLELVGELLENYRDGRVKLYVTWKALQQRNRDPQLFVHGAYVGLEAGEHAVAFARQHEGRTLITAVPRFSLRLTEGQQPWPLGGVWGNTRLPLTEAGRYRNLLTGEVLEGESSLDLAEVFAHFPVALLERL